MIRRTCWTTLLLLSAPFAFCATALEAAPNASELARLMASNQATIQTLSATYTFQINSTRDDGRRMATTDTLRIHFARPDRLALIVSDTLQIRCDGTNASYTVLLPPEESKFYVSKPHDGNLAGLVREAWPAGEELVPDLTALWSTDPAQHVASTLLANTLALEEARLDNRPCWRITTTNAQGAVITHWWEISAALPARWEMEYRGDLDRSHGVASIQRLTTHLAINQPLDAAIFELKPGTNDFVGSTPEEAFRAAARARGEPESRASCIPEREESTPHDDPPAFDPRQFDLVWTRAGMSRPAWYASTTEIRIAPATYVTLAKNLAIVTDAHTGATLAEIRLPPAESSLLNIQHMTYLRHGTNGVLVVLSTVDDTDDASSDAQTRTSLTALEASGATRWTESPVRDFYDVQTMEALPTADGGDLLYLTGSFDCALYDATGRRLFQQSRSAQKMVGLQAGPDAGSFLFTVHDKSVSQHRWPKLEPAADEESEP